jgi:hypothetical protein
MNILLGNIGLDKAYLWYNSTLTFIDTKSIMLVTQKLMIMEIQ